MDETSTITEADILADVIVSDRGGMTTEAAREVLQWRFSNRATDRMRTLLDRSNRGLMTPEEEVELDKYRRVGLLLDLLHVRARTSLDPTAET